MGVTHSENENKNEDRDGPTQKPDEYSPSGDRARVGEESGSFDEV